MPTVINRAIWSRGSTQWSAASQDRCQGFEDRGSFIVPCAGVISNLRVTGTLASGRTRTITLRKGTIGSLSSTALTCSYTEPATTAQDITHAVSVAAGDCLSWQGTVSPTTSGDDDLDISYDFTPTTPGQMFYPWVNGSNQTGPLWTTLCIGTDTNWPGGAVGDIIGDVVAAAGNLTRYDIKQISNLGAGTAWHFYIWKNDVKQDGTGGTVNTQLVISGDAVNKNVGTWSGTLPLAVGDTLKLGVAAGAGSPASSMWQGAVCISHSTPTNTNFFCTTGNSVSNSVDNFNGRQSIISWNTTEANRTVRVGVTGFKLTACYLKASVAPGGAASLTVRARKNSASPGGTLAAVVSGASTTGFDTSGQTTYAPGDTFSVLSTPASAPNTGRLNVGFAQGALGSGGGGNPKGGPQGNGPGGKRIFGPTGFILWDAVNGFGQ